MLPRGQEHLDELDVTEFSVGQTKIKRVAKIQFIMNKGCGYCGCSFQIKIKPYVTEVTSVIESDFTEAET